MKPLLILFVHGLGATSENTWGEFRRLIDEDDTPRPAGGREILRIQDREDPVVAAPVQPEAEGVRPRQGPPH